MIYKYLFKENKKYYTMLRKKGFRFKRVLNNVNSFIILDVYLNNRFIKRINEITLKDLYLNYKN